jgi:hypothetical protein
MRSHGREGVMGKFGDGPEDEFKTVYIVRFKPGRVWPHLGDDDVSVVVRETREEADQDIAITRVSLGAIADDFEIIEAQMGGFTPWIPLAGGS